MIQVLTELIIGLIVACVLALTHQVVPPTANYETPDPEITADVVHGEARAIGEGVALSNSFGFGGSNTTLVLRKVA